MWEPGVFAMVQTEAVFLQQEDSLETLPSNAVS